MEMPLGLVCIKCGTVFGSLLNPSLVIAKDRPGQRVEAVCTPCVTALKREKGIVPDSPESWARLLE